MNKKMYMRFPGGKPKALTLTYDDGMEGDKRLVEILDSQNMKGTFNLNSGLFGQQKDEYRKRMTAEEVEKLFFNSVHEVACHTLSHPSMEQLPNAAVMYEIFQNKTNLEKILRKPVRGFVYPNGAHNDDTTMIVKRCGMAYARIRGRDIDFRIPDDWYHWKPTVHHNSQEMESICDKFLKLGGGAGARIFSLMGHSYEFLRDDNWNVIEDFAKKMSNKDDIWYATNIEIHDYVEDYKNLQLTADHSVVHNPCAQEIFFFADGKEYSVKPAETLCIK